MVNAGRLVLKTFVARLGCFDEQVSCLTKHLVVLELNAGQAFSVQ